MNPSRIEWVEYPWNPITGCLGECEYCVSRKQSKRFTGDRRLNLKVGEYEKKGDMYILNEKFVSPGGGTLNYPFGFVPTYHRYRFSNIDQLKETRNILVCSDGEMFGPWVPDEIIEEIFDVCKRYTNHHFLFLTRYPERYEDLAEAGKLPKADNFWYGWTITGGGQLCWDCQGEYNTYVCIEPMLDEVPAIPIGVKWVILGAETGARKDKVIPKFEWVKDVVVACDYAAVPVFITDSMLGIVPKESMRKEYPKYLLEKEVGAALKEKLFDVCMECSSEQRKNEMITLSARSARGEQPKQFGFMCKECFRKFCKERDVEIPQLRNI